MPTFCHIAPAMPEKWCRSHCSNPARVNGELQLAQNLEDVFVAGHLADGIDPAEGQLALLVDDEDSALVDAGDGIALAQNAELFRDPAVRVEVAGQRKAQDADFLL